MSRKNSTRPGSTYKGHSRDGWTHKKDHSSIQLSGKQYRDMSEWSRPCIICSDEFFAYEKIGAPTVNSHFGTKTCEEHRKLLPAVERGFLAWDPDLNGMVAGIRCVRRDAPAVVHTNEAYEALRAEAQAGFNQAGEIIAKLRAENAELKTKIAALEAKKPFDPHETLRQELALKNNLKKLPWEG